MSSPGVLASVRVLVAHRDRATRAAIRALLGAVGAEVAEAAGTATVMARVRRDQPHVLLLDVELCRRDARPVLREITGDPDLLGTATVLLQPDAPLEDVVTALEDGAVDVWTAPGPDAGLVARVRAAHRSRMLLDLALRRFTDLEDLAYTDELTGLPNRRGATRRLDALLSRSRRHQRDLAVLLLDADHFKAVNDRHGHAVGDAVLRELAALLRSRVRREDVVGRWGGEELVVALSDTDEAGAAALAEDLRAAVAAQPLRADGVDVPLTVSIGVASWRGEDLDGLVMRADRALYAAKEAGRNRIVVEAAARAA
ncbi:MAG: diguanylate cyclase [Solirubrobacterales bacterium]|nr:diguanylate cyclase [Solirubrobacterales bacterium]